MCGDLCGLRPELGEEPVRGCHHLLSFNWSMAPRGLVTAWRRQIPACSPRGPEELTATPTGSGVFPVCRQRSVYGPQARHRKCGRPLLS